MPKLIDLAARRAELLNASLDLVAREGMEAATMRRLAAAAGCTTGAVTHFFPSRHALLIGMLRHAHRAAALRMNEATRRENDPKERLKAVVDEALPLDAVRLREWRIWIAFWSAAAGNDALAAENAARYHEWRALVTSLVKLSGTRDPSRQTSRLLALIDGYGLQLTLAYSPRSKQYAAQTAAARAELALAIG